MYGQKGIRLQSLFNVEDLMVNLCQQEQKKCKCSNLIRGGLFNSDCTNIILYYELSLGTAVSVMAKMPLLECLTRHSYRECQERLRFPAERENLEEESDDEKSTNSVLCSVKPAVCRKSLSSSGSFGHSAKNSILQEEKDIENSMGSPQRTIAENELSEEMKDQAFFNVSLLDWINVQDRPNDVESLVRKCFDSMNRVSTFESNIVFGWYNAEPVFKLNCKMKFSLFNSSDHLEF